MISNDLWFRLQSALRDEELPSTARHALRVALVGIRRDEAEDAAAYALWKTVRDCLRGTGSVDAVVAAARLCSRVGLPLERKGA